ncbi:MAG: hypothetical protein ACI9FZ_000961 [Bacteroidia bacterium]|jgi:hypothetical protein
MTVVAMLKCNVWLAGSQILRRHRYFVEISFALVARGAAVYHDSSNLN